MEPVRVLSDDLVLVDWGPMTLSISVWRRGVARPVMAAQAARLAIRCLRWLADFQNYLKQPAEELPRGRSLPSVVSRACLAARRVGAGLTPLAAVAGAAADEVAEFALGLGADRVVVNNGGDIALRLRAGERLRVGVKAPGGDLLGRLNLQARHHVGGVASSGWQGRSFSRGVADLVTVWAREAALADAAATALANAVDVEDGPIERRPARELDPASDLGDTPVTTAVGRLDAVQREQALAAGRRVARDLHRRGLILGCLIQLQGDRMLFDPGRLLPL